MASGSTHPSLLTPTIIAREALRLLKNNLVMGNLVYRAYESEFPGQPKKGGTVTIRKPVKFTVTKARTRATSYISEQSITLTVATQAHVSWAFNTADLTLTIDEYSERYIRPAASVLANTVDGDLCALYDDIGNVIWDTTGFVTPGTFMTLGRSMQRLDEEACPPEDRVIVFNPAAHWSMANALTQLYMPAVGEKALRKGYLGTIANADVYMDQNIKSHTVGRFHYGGSAWTSTIIIATTARQTAASTGTLPSGSSAVRLYHFCITGAKVLAVGDWFELEGVYAVNPMSGESTGSRRQFTVTADVSVGITDSSTAGQVSVSIYPPIIDTGPYKTVDTVPGAGAAAYMWQAPGSVIPQNLAFHKNAFALVMVPLQMPEGAWGTTVTEDGFSCRVVKDYDIDVDDEIIRLDILYGVKTIYPELAVRIAGAAVGNTDPA